MRTVCSERQPQLGPGDALAARMAQHLDPLVGKENRHPHA